MPRVKSAVGIPRRRGRWLVALALLWLLGSLATACQGGFKLPWIGGSNAAGAARVDADEVEVVVFGTWYEHALHCAEGRCEVIYGVHVAETGRLRADVYAPWGGEYPEFDLVLLDERFVPIARPTKPNARPRRLEHDVEPGDYFLRIQARGTSDGRLKFDLVAQLDGPRPTAAARPSAPRPAAGAAESVVREASTAPKPRVPVAEVEARPLLVTAEVLDIVKEKGAGTFVLLDAGRPQHVEARMKGELVEQGRAIGEIEIVDVFEDGCRARIIGDLTGEVGIDTVAHIFR